MAGSDGASDLPLVREAFPRTIRLVASARDRKPLPALAGCADQPDGVRIEGYADVLSVLPGEPVGLHVSSTAPTYTVEVLRTGNYEGRWARKVWSSGPAGAEVPMRIVREGRETWLRVKSADRNSFLRKPLL